MSKTRAQLIALIDSSFDDSLKRRVAIQALLESTELASETTQYTPTTSADWTVPVPTTVQAALDKIAQSLGPI